MNVLSNFAAMAGHLKRRHLWLWSGGIGILACSALTFLCVREMPPTSALTPDVPGGGLATDPEIATAIEAAREVVVREPKSGIAWGRLGQVLHVHNFTSPAVTCYEEAERLDPSNADWPYLRGVILSAGAAPGDSIPLFLRAAELGQKDRLPQIRMCETLLDLGRFDEAAKELEQLLAADPNSPRVHLRLAQVEVARQNWRGCLKHLEAVGDNPFAHKKSLYLRILAHQQVGDESAAKREQAALAQLPNSLDPFWPDSVFDQMVSLKVGMASRVERARALLQAGDTPGALSLLTRTVCDYPEAEPPWTALGRALAMVGDYPSAEDFLLKSVELAPERPDIWSSLGFVRLKRKDHGGARECYRRVIRLKPNDAEAHFHLGECLEIGGDRAGARQEYGEALHFQPDYPEARERLAKLPLTPKEKDAP